MTRPIPPERRFRTVFLVAGLAFALLSSAAAFDLRLNGVSKSVPTDAGLRALSYAIPLKGSMGRGFSVSELLPPLVEAWEIGCAGPGGTRTWTGDDLADRLSEFYIVESGSGGWDFLAPDGRVVSFSSINVSGDPAQERELEVWLSWEGVPELKAEIERWASQAGVRVRTVDVPDTRSKLLAVLRGGGRVPDLVMIQSDNLPDLIESKALQPLDRIDSGHIAGKGGAAFAAEGKAWAMPFYFDAQLLFYNRRMLPGAPPLLWTTADLEAMAAKIARAGKTPLSWNLYSAYWLLPFARGFGKPSIADSDGGVRPDDRGTKEAIAWILSLIDDGLLEPLERDAMVARFASGEIAMILSGSYSIPEFERIGLDFGVAPYPIASPTGKPIAPLLDFTGFAMTRSTRSPVTARRLLEYLSGVGVQQRFSAALSKLPANSDAWKVSEKTNRYHAQLSRSAEIGAVIPPSAGYSIYKNTMWKILRFILSGSMKTDAALGEARRIIDANLAAR